VLTETAALLREVFRESDIIGRLGGDEFAVLMMEDAGEFDGTMVLDRLHAAVRSRNARAAGRSLLSMSIGVQPYDPEQPCSLEKLIAQADVLMYEEKKVKKRV
jgi:two-component system cell cycle response regulator